MIDRIPHGKTGDQPMNETTELLSCGCAPYRSRLRARCDVALDMHHEFKRLQQIEWDRERDPGPATPAHKRAMENRLRQWDRYTEHLRGADEQKKQGEQGEQGEQTERRSA